MNDRLADLRRDPEVQRCLRVVEDADWTIDDLLACYGPAESGLAERGFEESTCSDEALYLKLSAMHGVRPTEEAQTDESTMHEDVASRTQTFGPPPEELIAVPEYLAASIERTYEELASRGALPEGEFEQRAAAWLSGESGA